MAYKSFAIYVKQMLLKVYLEVVSGENRVLFKVFCGDDFCTVRFGNSLPPTRDKLVAKFGVLMYFVLCIIIF